MYPLPSSGKEVVNGTATLPAGMSLGFQEHPGVESGYLFKGSVIWEVRVSLLEQVGRDRNERHQQ